MEKINLKDGTKFEIENGASVNFVQVPLPTLNNFNDFFETFSEENLEKFQIQNAEGLTCATLENKYLYDVNVKKRENDYLITLQLADVNLLEKRVAAIEAEQENIKSGQNLQDGAIADMGDIIGEMLEGGEV